MIARASARLCRPPSTPPTAAQPQTLHCKAEGHHYTAAHPLNGVAASLTQPIYERAAAQIEYIRDTMNQASAFTAVPGMGLMLIGLSAVGTWLILHTLHLTHDQQLVGWMLNALVALPIGLATLYLKARRLALPLWRGPGRRFLLALAPSGLAAGALTIALYQHQAQDLVHGVWMITYGIGVMAAGAYSIRPVPVMGALFLGCGIVDLLAPQLTAEIMVVAFGGLHLTFGYIIWKHHGG